MVGIAGRQGVPRPLRRRAAPVEAMARIESRRSFTRWEGSQVSEVESVVETEESGEGGHASGRRKDFI